VPYSSADIISFAEHLGCKQGKGTGKRGSHRTWHRPGEEGQPSYAAPIPLNKKEIPDGTIAAILRQLGTTKADLRKFIGH